MWPFPPPNVRLLAAQTASVEIYLDPNPDDGAQLYLVSVGADFATNPYTIHANGHLIEDAATLVIDTALASPMFWFYRADTANWQRVETLTIDDEMPFPAEFDDYFIIALNVRLSSRNAKDIKQGSVARFEQIEGLIKTRYRQTPRTTVSPSGTLFRTRQTLGARSGGGDLG